MTRNEMIEALDGKQIFVDLWNDKFAIIKGIFYLPDGDFDLTDQNTWTDYAIQKMFETSTF